MRFAANTFIWADSFAQQHFTIFPRLKESRLDGIEIDMLAPESFPSSALRWELENLELGCTSCSVLPPNLRLISEDKGACCKPRTHVEDCLNATTETGGRLLCGPLYCPVSHFTGHRRTLDEWRRAVESWQQLAQVAAKAGVQVAIEPLNRFETYFLNTAADASDQCAKIDHPNFGILFDTFHANILAPKPEAIPFAGVKFLRKITKINASLRRSYV